MDFKILPFSREEIYIVADVGEVVWWAPRQEGATQLYSIDDFGFFTCSIISVHGRFLQYMYTLNSV